MEDEQYLYNQDIKSVINKEKLLYYADEEVGKLRIDIFVEDKILLKVTNGDKLVDKDVEILQNELRMSRIEVELLLNFGLNPSQRRKINLQ